jgi:cobalamin biosynthesis protein CobD/CbiB
MRPCMPYRPVFLAWLHVGCTKAFAEALPIVRTDRSAFRLPVAGQRMIFVAGRKGVSLNQQQQHVAQLRNVLTALLSELHIAAELSATYRSPH